MRCSADGRSRRLLLRPGRFRREGACAARRRPAHGGGRADRRRRLSHGRDGWPTRRGVVGRFRRRCPATGRSGIGATKIRSAVEGGALAALENADESAGSPDDAPAASYTVRQGDTLSLIAKKYYGNGRKIPRPHGSEQDHARPPGQDLSRHGGAHPGVGLRMPTLARGRRVGRVARAQTTSATIPAELRAHDRRLPLERLRTTLSAIDWIFRANVIWITDRRRRYGYHAARCWVDVVLSYGGSSREQGSEERSPEVNR